MSGLGLIAAGYLAVCLLLYIFQRNLLYFPQQLTASAKPYIQTLDTNDGSLNLSVRNVDDSQAIIFFGGNADDVSQYLLPFSNAFPEHALFLVHYRGYGGSTGEPTEQAFHSDAREVYQLVSQSYSKITVIGRSLGTGVAIRLAREQDVEKLILISPYDSIAAVAQGRFRIFPVNLLMLDRFDSLQHAPHIDIPSLIITAETDGVIPHRHTDKLVAGMNPAVLRTATIAGTNHNSIFNNPESFVAIKEFLADR
ncbi:MAG: hypothetical protein GKR91_09300 [Pseudomonadales bacterium]|nr:hypothetical protein [Pseudomonadales bacterium]